MSPARCPKLTIALIATLIIGGWAGWYTVRGQTHIHSENPADYASALTRFQHVASIAPPTIPAGAQDTKFSFEWRYYLFRPTRLTLDAEFMLPGNEAKQWMRETLAHARDSVKDASPREGSVVRVLIQNESVLLIADETSGLVKVHVSKPAMSGER